MPRHFIELFCMLLFSVVVLLIWCQPSGYQAEEAEHRFYRLVDEYMEPVSEKEILSPGFDERMRKQRQEILELSHGLNTETMDQSTQFLLSGWEQGEEMDQEEEDDLKRQREARHKP